MHFEKCVITCTDHSGIMQNQRWPEILADLLHPLGFHPGAVGGKQAQGSDSRCLERPVAPLGSFPFCPTPPLPAAKAAQVRVLGH